MIEDDDEDERLARRQAVVIETRMGDRWTIASD
jgi:hypothetical protein